MDFNSAMHGVDELGPPSVVKMVSFMSGLYGVGKLTEDPNIDEMSAKLADQMKPGGVEAQGFH